MTTWQPFPLRLADVVAGGWPCQDISVAGLQEGLRGERSGLFFEMLRIAEEAAAHTLIAENVPHLLRMDNGKAFELAIRSLEDADYPFVSWRTLNAREFGLPHASARLASNLPDFVDLEDTRR